MGKQVEQKQLQPKSYIEVGSKEESEYLVKLAQDIMKTDDDFVKFIQDAKLAKDSKLDSEIDMMNMYYQRRLMWACVEPLTKGVNSDSLIESIGMYVGICLVSPDFRKECDSCIQEMMYPMVERKAAKAGPDSVWAKRRDAILKEQNGGRIPLTPKSAALMEIGFSRRAYNAMREPGADIGQVMEQYHQAVGLLHEQANADGIDMDTLGQTKRIIIGQMIEQDASYSQYFTETAYNGVKQSPYQEVSETIQTESGPKVFIKQVWNGEFQNPDGSEYTGSFTPRVPVDENAHMQHIGEFFQDEFQDCKTTSQLYKTMDANKHKQARSIFMDMMFADNVSINEIQNHMSDVLKVQLQGWMQAHPEAVEAELNRKYQQEQANKQQGSTKGRGHEFDDMFRKYHDDMQYT